MVSLDLLEKSEVFKGLNDSQLAAVQGCCEEKEYQREDRIFAEGDDSTHLCIVMEGQVDLRFDLPGKPTSEENTISSLGETLTFQWSSLVPPHKTRLASYCNSRTCKVVQVDREKLVKIFEKDPQVGYVVMSNIALIVGTRFYSLQEKVATRAGYDIMFDW